MSLAGDLPGPVDLLVLAGGRGTRLGGRDKGALVVAGRSLLERILGDADLGGATVVVGTTPLPHVEPGRIVLQTLEDPPDGGPVAGIAAGLAVLAEVRQRPTGGGSRGAVRPPGAAELPDWVAVVAVDQPGAAPALAALHAELGCVGVDVEAISHVDTAGKRQWLLAIYRRTALERALASLDEVRGASVRGLVSGLTWREVSRGAEHVGDVDTWDDLAGWTRPG